MDIDIPRYAIYTYKNRQGWYPHYIRGFMRLCGAIKVFEDKDDAIRECPMGYKVVRVYVNFKLEPGRKGGD